MVKVCDQANLFVETLIMNRSLLLDCLRVLAIALVLIAHLGQLLGHESGDFFGWKNIYFVSLGGVGVSLFLVLSGILTGLGKPVSVSDYTSYLLKKTKRIYPLYWLSLPLAITGYVLSEGVFRISFSLMFPNGLLLDAAGSLTGFYAWWGLWGGPYNPPSWYISLIMCLYASAPLIVYSMQRWSGVTLLVLFCISVFARWYVGQWGLPFTDSSVIDRVEGWLYRQYGFMPGRPGDWFLPCRLFEFGLGIYLALKLPKTLWTQARLPASAAIRKLSDLSFPLFLVHYPFLFLVHVINELGLHIIAASVIYLGMMLLLAEGLSRLERILLLRLKRTKAQTAESYM